MIQSLKKRIIIFIEWYPEITDEEVLEIEKLHEYNRNFARKTTGEIVETPQN